MFGKKVKVHPKNLIIWINKFTNDVKPGMM